MDLRPTEKCMREANKLLQTRCSVDIKFFCFCSSRFVYFVYNLREISDIIQLFFAIVGFKSTSALNVCAGNNSVLNWFGSRVIFALFVCSLIFVLLKWKYSQYLIIILFDLQTETEICLFIYITKIT